MNINFLVKEIKIIIIIYLNLNCSPSSSAVLGGISNIPDIGSEWPPYAYSTKKEI